MKTDSTASDQVADEAVDWYLKLRSDDDPMCSETIKKTAADRHQADAVEFDHWLRADDECQRQFKYTDDCWIASGALKDSKQLAKTRDIIEQLKQQAIEDKKSAGEQLSTITPKIEGKQRLNAVVKTFLALAATLVLAVVLYWGEGVDKPADPQRYYTQVGERQTLELADGSTITLNTKSTVDVLITETRRELTLLRGQAIFDVAHDKARPFRVNVGASTVTALGTSFDIDKRCNTTKVSLFEGSVEVVTRFTGDAQTQNEHPPQQRVILQPGEQLRYVDTSHVVEVNTIDPSTVGAWREGKMKFHNTPLSAAIEEVNRYSEVQVQLENSALGELLVSGIFQVGRNEDFARAVVSFHGLKMRSTVEQNIVISQSAKGKQND